MSTAHSNSIISHWNHLAPGTEPSSSALGRILPTQRLDDAKVERVEVANDEPFPSKREDRQPLSAADPSAARRLSAPPGLIRHMVGQRGETRTRSTAVGPEAVPCQARRWIWPVKTRSSRTPIPGSCSASETRMQRSLLRLSFVTPADLGTFSRGKGIGGSANERSLESFWRSGWREARRSYTPRYGAFSSAVCVLLRQTVLPTTWRAPARRSP